MAPRLPFRLPNLGPRTRLVLRYAGLTVFGIIVFVFALQMTFPYGRVKDKLVEALSDKYDVTIGSVERGYMPGRVYFKAVTLRTRQSSAAEVVNTFFIKQVEVDAGLLSLIGGTISADIEAQIGSGTLSASIQIGKFGRGDVAASFTGDSLPGDALPMRAALGLPITGTIEFAVNLALPVEKSKLGRSAINWQKARGSFSLACPKGCTFGDGKTKLKPVLKNARNQVMVGEGIDFGQVNLDSLVAKVTIKPGNLTLDRFDARSKDGELKVDYSMTLEKEFGESVVAGCLRFRGSDELLKRDPKTYAAIQTTGAELRSDGLFHIRLTGPFKSMKRLNKECGPNTQINNGENFSNERPERPGLTVQPEDAAKPAITTPVPTPAETAPPPQDMSATPPTPSPTPTPGDGDGDGAPPAGSAATPGTEMTRDAAQGSGTRDGAQNSGDREGAREPSRDPQGTGTGSAPMPPPE